MARRSFNSYKNSGYSKSKSSYNSKSDNFSSGWKKTSRGDDGIITFESFTESSSNVRTKGISTFDNFSRNFNLNFTLDLNYGGTIQFMLYFALMVLFISFGFNGGFSKVFTDNSIRESIEVVDGYSYDVFYTYYNWTEKVGLLSNIKGVFTFQDIINYGEALTFEDGFKLTDIVNIISIPVQILGNIINDIIAFVWFLVSW